ncbi:metalloregulator ArsR/SmtB family transcription factor [Alicyclobacillus tolerans]|uniref:ArsR/SmtB family transcription factor n=1 Tax=Alicyclobacillus tolerans TaxID=90970 RepID=UPI001F029B8C|nr:metalloregulator ArsR/SmtB family transcription factor [Alicyclobacillus tolerans]MCF8568290.1 metalloregulator ArsR/SmtB family transcription factor [Alicyclobacillus tolerans]
MGRAIQTRLRHVIDLDLVFKALADPLRRSLLETLSQKQYFCTLDGEVVDGICVQDLTSILNVPQSTISRHLALLRQAGLVGHQQRGPWHYYFCNQDALQAVDDWIDSLQRTETDTPC